MVERRLALPAAARGPEFGPGGAVPQLPGPEPFLPLSAEGSAAPRPDPESSAKAASAKPEAPLLDKDGEEIQPLPIPIARLVPKLKKSAKLFEEGKKYIPN